MRITKLLLVAVVLSVFVLYLIPLTSLAQEAPGSPIQLGADFPGSAEVKYPRLDSYLNSLVDRLETTPAAQIAATAPLSRGEAIGVVIRLAEGSVNAAEALTALGIPVANVGPDYIEAYVPLSVLASVASQPGVLAVQTLIPPQPLVTSQGVGVHGASGWQAGGYNGAGIRVGIIDVGFIGYSGLMGSELPASVTARCYTTMGAFTSTLADCQTEDKHGTGVAEAVFDMAPGATFFIANPMSQGDLLATTQWMISQGVQIINHSVIWAWDGPGDGTSPFSDSPLKSVEAAVAGGALWVNGAGNQARVNWRGPITDADSDGWLEFQAGGEVNAVSLSAGKTYYAQARWDDSWGNAARNLDLYLYNSAVTAIVASSTDPQSGAAGQYPYEWVGYNVPTTGTYYLAIRREGGSVPPWVQLESFSGETLSTKSADHSIANPAESASLGMLAVGAASWATTSTIEPFSSQGPTTDGRTKPDLVGADRGDSVTYGTGGFAGTSQASPHVAGLAALVRQRYPGLTPSQVAGYLKATALPRGAAPNNTWGYGFAQLPSAQITGYSPSIATTVTVGQNVTLGVTFTNSGSAPWQFIAGATVWNASGDIVKDYSTTLSSPLGVGQQTTVNWSHAVNQAGDYWVQFGVWKATPFVIENLLDKDPSPSQKLIVGQEATVPSSPTNVVATPGNAQATVTWAAPASNGGSPITGYTVTGNPGGSCSVGNVLSCTVTGLTNGVTYTFTVKAINIVGTGPASAPSNAVTPATVPGAPTGVTATAGNAQATITWAAPTSNGGSAITGYTVTSNPGGKTASVGGSTLAATVTGLTNGTSYTFTVVASNTIGPSIPSAASNAVTPATVPGTPTGVAATAGNAQATVTWNAPASNGGSVITKYTVKPRNVTDSVDLPSVDTADGSVLTKNISGLTNGKTYTFTVTATNAKGEGAPSAASNAVTPATVPDAPTGVAATAGNAQATVTWNAPTSTGGSPITGYTVTTSPGGATVTVGNVTNATVTSLTNGTAYTFTVKATNAMGTGPAGVSNAVTPTAPAPPTIGVITTTPTTLLEGTAFTLSAAFTDTDASDTHTASITWGDGSSSAGTVNQAAKIVTSSHTYADNGNYTITVKVVDSGSPALSGSKTHLVAVGNVAPAVNAGADKTISEGGTFTSGGAFTDPGADTWTATVNSGDGSGSAALTLNVDKSFTLSHLYTNNGMFTVTVTVTDDDGGAGSDTTIVTVNNVAPAVNAGADAAISEGGTFASSGSFIDPGADTWTATVNYGDGSGAASLALSGKSFALSHLYKDNGTFGVAVTVTDSDASSGSDTIQVTVSNVAPVVAAGPDQKMKLGVPVSLPPATFTDPGVLDTHTAAIIWGDGSGAVAGTVNEAAHTVSGSHTYSAAGLFTVTVTVTDKDGGVGSATFKVSDVNAPPVITSVAAPQRTSEGSLLDILVATFTDPDGADTHTASIDWGDGSPATPGVVSEAAKSVTGNHVYADNGAYTVKITVSDGESTASGSFAVTAANLAPTASVPTPAPLNEGGGLVIKASFNDPGTLDTHTATVDWGDGSGVQPLAVTETPFGPPGSTDGMTGTAAGNHPYVDNGRFRVTVCVKDDDGATRCDTANVQVANVPPVLKGGIEFGTVEGTPLSLGPLDFTDPGSGDTHKARVDWGDGSPATPASVNQTADSVSASHVYADNGAYTITVTVADDDDGVGSATFTVKVTNAAPQVKAPLDRSVVSGFLFSAGLALYDDPGKADTHVAVIDWGDGTASKGSVYGGVVYGIHRYAKAGVYTVNITVIDDDGGIGKDTLVITASAVPSIPRRGR